MKPLQTNPFMPNYLAIAIAALILLPGQASASQPLNDVPGGDFTSLSLEDLMNIEVTSAMKSASRLNDTPAAIFVLTSEDIRRTGATSIPEALRIVPGMHVARLDANKWVVSVRGFSTQFANKLLVLVDGRSVYTPLFSGVWWDQQDVLMEDIERIEVIRGPGASLWGANAVNGIINIITKNTRDTQGTLVSAHAGNERGGVGLRHGAKVGDDAYLRVYGRYVTHDDSPARGSNEESIDHDRQKKMGFRFDKILTTRDKLMFQGEAFSGYSGGASKSFPSLTASLTPVLAPPYNTDRSTWQESKGHNLLGRWERALEQNSAMSLQVYWDHHERILDEGQATNRVDTFDMDFQHSTHLTERQRLVWGMGYRRNQNDSAGSLIIDMSPRQRSDDIYNVFVQDDITLVPERWKLTLGAKLERNPSTGYEFQPNARLLWTPDDRHAFWGSVSRAVRTPSWAEQNVTFSQATIPPFTAPNLSPFPLLIANQPNPALRSENLVAYELGWRGLVTPAVSADATLFYYDYRDASTVSPGEVQLMPPLAPPSYLLQPVYFTNHAKGHTYGGELSASWQVTEKWKLRANYAYFESSLGVVSDAPANTTINYNKTYPRHQAMLWSMHQLAPKVQLDLNLRYVGDLNMAEAPGDYAALDARIAWKVQPGMEVALVGRNLLDKDHPEFGSDSLSVTTNAPREVFATVRWDF